MELKIKAWVARDKGDKHANLYCNVKPLKSKKYGIWGNQHLSCHLEPEQFSEVKWSDKEPKEVEITIKEI